MALTRRLLALLILLALTVAAPIALWLLGRDLLPSSIPTPAQAWDALTTQDTGQLFMGALVVIGFVAWAVFAFSVLVEFAAALVGLRGGGARTARLRRHMLRMPLVGSAQGAAAALVSALLAGVLLTQGPAAAASTSTGLPPIPHAAAVASTNQAQATPTASTSAPTPMAAAAMTAAAGPVWIVQPGDTLWDIAEQSLGDPLRFDEIITLNDTTVQPDGGRLASSSTWLEVGWQLQLPGDATPQPATAAALRDQPQQLTVQPGDTLSQIAQDTLGSADLYPQLAAANAIADPDVITAGTVIVIPIQQQLEQAGTEHIEPPAAAPPATTGADPTGHAAASDPQQPPTDAGPAPTDPGPTPAADTGGPTGAGDDAAAPAHAAPASEPDSATGDPAPAGSPTAGPAPAAEATVPASPTDTAAEQAPVTAAAEEDSPALLYSGLGGMTAAGVLAALLLARRRGHRRRRPGRSAAITDLRAARVEKAARAAADGKDPAWIDQALRLMATLSADSDQIPDVLGAVAGADGLRLHLNRPIPAPEPFTQQGKDWWLPATAAMPLASTDRDTALAPLPTLVTVAVTGSHTYLLDLERAGAIRVTGRGDEITPRHFLNHLVADLATNLWSDDLTVTLVGWGRQLLPLNPHRLNHLGTVAEANRLLQSWLAETEHTLAGHGGGDALTARVHDRDADAFVNPQVLLVDAQHTDDQDLADLRRHIDTLTATPGARCATAVVITGQTGELSAQTPIRLGPGRSITVGPMGSMWQDVPLTASQLTDTEIEVLVQRLALADQPDEPAAAAADPHPWAQNMDTLGALHDRVTDPADDPSWPAWDQLEELPTAAEVMGYAAAPALGNPGTADAISGHHGCEPSVAAGDADDRGAADHATAVVDQAATADPALDQGLSRASIGSLKGVAEPDVEEGVPGVVDIRPGAAAAARQLAITLAADPDLDTDLQQWSDPATTRPRIGILGPVTLTVTGAPPRDRRARNIELATYLALHPRGVTADRVATDLWPEGAHPRPVTVRELLSAVRKWLGHNPVDGSQYMPNAEAGVYRLKSRLLDSELLRRLHKRAQAKADATDLQGALADFVQALELVRLHDEGLPIWEYTSQPYSWVATIDHPEGRQLPAMISDVSYEAAELALRLGNLEVARWAAEIGHAVTPESDRPLCQLLLVAKAAGQIEVAKGLVDQILSVNDATGPEECPPWAVEAIRAVFPAAPVRVSATR